MVRKIVHSISFDEKQSEWLRKQKNQSELIRSLVDKEIKRVVKNE
jgi:hypothetical protein